MSSNTSCSTNQTQGGDCASCACQAPLTIAPVPEKPSLDYGVLARLVGALILVLVASQLETSSVAAFTIFLGAYALAGSEILYSAGRNIMRGKIFDENFLMSVASLGAFAIGERAEAVAVLLFYGVGEYLQDRAVARSRNNIAALMDIRPDSVTVLEDGLARTVHPSEVTVGALIQVKAGELVALDGVVVKGNSFVDTKALTGEPVPVHVAEGVEVLSGSVNQQTTLTLRVIRPLAESTVTKILNMVEYAAQKKAQTEQFITKFARVYTPIVCGLAALVAIVPPLLGYGSFSEWLYRGLVFLVISCPCALVLSIPLSFFGGIGGAARQGILVKGGNYLEALADVGTIVLDKTGTLTEGVVQVTEVVANEPWTEHDVVSLAASAEEHSSHPIAESIRTYAVSSGIAAFSPENITELSGRGVVAEIDDATVLVGNRNLMHDYGIANVPVFPTTVVYVAREGVLVGHLLLEDTVRPESWQAVHTLKSMGIRNLVMLTGDAQLPAENVGKLVGIDDVRSHLLPDGKVAELENVIAQARSKSKVLFVGDGINDAPVLARADIGVAMGGIGSDAAIEAADVVIMNDDLNKLGLAIAIGRKTRTIVTQNIVFALGTKGVIMALAAFGITSIWAAIFADVGVALIALFNALRALQVRVPAN